MKVELPMDNTAVRTASRSGRLSARQVAFLLAAATLSTLAGYAGYQRLAAPAQPVAAPQTVPARLGSLVSTVTTTGSVVITRLAKLSFSADGKLTELNVAVGANVKAGQLLARQDPAPLQSKITSTESALKVAQINLEQLKAGATPEELEAAQVSYDLAAARYREIAAGATGADLQAAESAVGQATANLASAEAKLADLEAGPTQAELGSARASVESARAGLASAQAKLAEVRAGSTTVDLASAQASIESTRAALAAAQEKLDLLKAGPTATEIASAQAAVQSARGSMITAEDRAQMAQSGDLTGAGGTSNSAVQQAYNTARANYESAVKKLQDLMAGPTAADLQSAQSAVTSARASHNSAAAKLEELQKGATAVNLASAESAAVQAGAALISAEAKLAELQEGATEVDRIAARSAVDQARASLATAQTKLGDLKAGPKASEILSARSSVVNARNQLSTKTTVKDSDIILQEEKVRQAQADLDQARLNLDSATMMAPFDGIVSAVPANVGERVASNAAVITLVDPRAFRIDVTVDESDVAKLAVGQSATVSFDALPDTRLQGKVISVAPTGTTQQGVVSYLVSVGVDNPGRSFPAGMSASVSVETERKDNVLLVPNRAVRTQGRNKVVEVMAGEKTEMRPVQVGSSNDQMTQITSGLREGEVVIIPTTTIRSTSSGGPAAPGGPGPGGTVIRVPAK